jgi:hypothetical protein
MAKRDRRSGVRFIEDGRDRSLTFFKRRSGLFKAASDLSTLTGARVAVVLESESGRFSSFGTPEASPIVDAFLLGSAPTDLDTSEADKASITNLQNEVFQLEKDKAMEDKRRKESLARSSRKVQQASKVARYVYGSVDDLDATELFEMYRELSRVQQEISDRLPTTLLHDASKADAGGGRGRLRDPSLLRPTWWRASAMPLPPLQQAATPPTKCPPWAPSQARFQFQQHPWAASSTSPPAVLPRSSGSPLPSSAILPSPLAPQNPSFLRHHHPLAPHTTPPTSAGVQFQAPRTPAPTEAQNPYTYYIRGIDIISGNSSHPSSLSPVMPSSSPTPHQQPSSLRAPPSDDSSPLSLSPRVSYPLHVGSPYHQQLPLSAQNHNSVQQPPPPPESCAHVVGSPLIVHSHQVFYSNLSPDLNAELGSVDDGGAGATHADGGLGLSSPQQSDGFDGVTPNKSFSAGQSSGSGWW